MRRLIGLKRLLMMGLVVVMLLAPTGAALAQGGTITHVVSPGENLYRISLRYGVSVQKLMQANRLPNSQSVYVGQRLSIPLAGPAGSSAVPAVPPPIAPQDPSVQEGATTHAVTAGENLYRISLRYGMNVQALAWANGLNNPHLIYVGQKLVIPNRQDVSASPTPTSLPDATISPATTPQSAEAVAPLATSLPKAVAAQPAPAASSTTGKEIVVVLHEQKAYAYENGEVVHSSLASTGLARYPTPVGQYRIYTKYISTLMRGPGYYLPNVPYTMYFYGGYGLHGTYWHKNFGHPMSHGCVNLPTAEARWFYEWAPVGTVVTVKR
jgi:LysM repeat protein